MGVAAIWRYPIKAMLGERLDRVEVVAGGLRGDRRWVVVDSRTGERIANKRGPTDARLRACRARLDGETVSVELPSGHDTACGEREIAAALSGLLGRRVQLEEHDGGGGRYLQTAGHHDFAPLHLMTTRTLARMRALAPGSVWDVRRFRPNVVLDDRAMTVPTDDDQLLGASLRSASGLELHVGLPTPRCVVTTRAQEELPADPAVLRAIASTNRWSLGPFGRPACLGAYAEVRRAGPLRVGDTLAVAPCAAGPGAAVAATVERVAADLAEG